MKPIFKKIIITLPLLIIMGVLVFPFLGTKASNNLISPWVSGSQTMINLWFPKATAEGRLKLPVTVSADSAFFVDLDSGRVLYQKNPHQKMAIASLTKIMTAIVALENYQWSDIIIVSQSATEMEPDHMLLQTGEKLTLEELLDGMFLVSANDAAEAVADSIEGGRNRFITLMNQKAQQLGMNETVFANPTGLDEDDLEQYSSAYDVALMSRYAVKHFPHLVDISGTYHIVLPKTQTHQDYDLYSGINLLTTYPGVIGFKTGYTPNAGMTLVTLAQKDNHRVLGVLLDSENRRLEAKALLDYSFQVLGTDTK